jgi:hypothetical protein
MVIIKIRILIFFWKLLLLVVLGVRKHCSGNGHDVLYGVPAKQRQGLLIVIQGEFIFGVTKDKILISWLHLQRLLVYR